MMPVNESIAIEATATPYTSARECGGLHRERQAGDDVGAATSLGCFGNSADRLELRAGVVFSDAENCNRDCQADKRREVQAVHGVDTVVGHHPLCCWVEEDYSY